MNSFKNKTALQEFLESKVIQYNHPSFIEADPISIPHRFSVKGDIEIAGLFAAVFAWGNRTTIIRKTNELIEGMDNAPHDFIKNHQLPDRKRFMHFKHRTFNSIDLFYFFDFLQKHYKNEDSLESAFIPEKKNAANSAPGDEFVKTALSVFYTRFFSLDNAPKRTGKHIASPEKNSTCKRLNMYLRWMVRQDKKGVDFGIWKKIPTAALICPVDLHVARVARSFGMITRKQTDWETAMELTRSLRQMDKKDPVKFDFALFGLGAVEKY
jgi:uncharacterized protein (TIGR02757 family)